MAQSIIGRNFLLCKKTAPKISAPFYYTSHTTVGFPPFYSLSNFQSISISKVLPISALKKDSVNLPIS